MTLTRTMRVLGATALSGALLMTAAPTASADQVRDGQWVNQYYSLDKVWSVSKGDGVIVAVIDTGVDANHQDLAGQVLPGYDPGGSGRDHKPTDPHGTQMAGEIAGKGHGANAGVVGLAPGAKILPVYSDSGGKSFLDGIRWAVDHGAKVINISLGSSAPVSASEKEAVAYALDHDVLVVSSAGNDGVSSVEAPANVPGVLAVAAVDKSITAWNHSNYGPEVLLSAPGTEMVSSGACDGGQYCIAEGTSDSSAYVSAAAALVRAKFPSLTAGQVANRLVKSALMPSAAKGAKAPDPHYGYGVLRPYEALTMDIPAGSAQGPLAAAASSGGSKAPSAGSSGAASAPPAGSLPPIAASDSGSKGASYLLIGVAVLVGLVLLVVVIVVLARSGRRQPQVQQPYAAPTWQPGQQPYGGQAPPPGYPQQQSYGGQAPQPGFPPHQQQPYQNNPYQDGNQQR